MILYLQDVEDLTLTVIILSTILSTGFFTFPQLVYKLISRGFKPIIRIHINNFNSHSYAQIR